MKKRKQRGLNGANNSPGKVNQLPNNNSRELRKRQVSFPFGQLILIRHHSEKWDRNDRGKVNRMAGFLKVYLVFDKVLCALWPR